MITKERLTELRAHWMSNGHKDWMELFFDMEALLRENEELKKCQHCGASDGELHLGECWTFKIKKLERVAEAAREADEYIVDCLNWEEDEVKSKKWWMEFERKHKALNESLQALRGSK